MDGKNLAHGVESSLAADLSRVEEAGAAGVKEIKHLAAEAAELVREALGCDPHPHHGHDHGPTPADSNPGPLGG